MVNKNSKSAKVQIAFFTLAPNLVVYLGLIAFIFSRVLQRSLGLVAVLSTAANVLLIGGALWSLISGFVLAANMSLINKICEPGKPVLKIKVGANKLDAVADMQSDMRQTVQFAANIFFTIVFTVPVVAAGWLLFLLYCKGKFLKKLRVMVQECDAADTILEERNGSLEDLAYYFYRMLDYVGVYKRLGEKKGANEMLSRAERLLALWEELYAE